ncbi:phage tail assembly chaperone [Loktanella sp. TSTF-M6]|uniref:Phage tail assembly chaperone n=1 Tax=Loktanella gaetbuli TaxID=2881335 RepID=A0ABS8BQ42_9RHOB|nr:rcc01693 family protein [Loktanella gaetbuli]MCB5197844.1 phage tail assembly chaperone [Loktanella gaetbuli]
MTRLDWAALMRAGMCQLGLAPDAFWRLTPAELSLMLGLADVQRPMDRSGLDALLAAFPDETESEGEDD